MNQVMLETVIIVMIVVVLFLGWRAGIVVGSIVPLTILATLLVMRWKSNCISYRWLQSLLRSGCWSITVL
jgi:Cu/Ag efflux pump CusA